MAPIGTGGNTSSQISNTPQAILEAGEVVDIILGESHPEYNDEGNHIGRALIRTQSQINKSDYILNWFAPAFPGICQYPLIGETVVCVVGFSASSCLNVGATVFYYLPFPVNGWGEVNENGLPSSSYQLLTRYAKPGDFDRHKGDASPTGPVYGDSFEAKDIARMQPFEGDFVVEGRWGNSIRLGSSAEPTNGDPNLYSEGGAKGDPIITIQNGYNDVSDTADGLHLEDWTAAGDKSQLTMCAGQKIPLEISSKNKDSYHHSAPPDEQDIFEGNQVIINSDRIVFNTKTDSILGTAKVSVGFSTEGTFNIDADVHTIIDSPKIYLGNASTDEAEPVAMGQTLVDWMQKLCTTLMAETHPTACGPSGPPINASAYGDLKSAAPDILSENSFCTKSN